MVSARDTAFRCGTFAAGQGGGGECLFADNYELLLILLNDWPAKGVGGRRGWQTMAQTRKICKAGKNVAYNQA